MGTELVGVVAGIITAGEVRGWYGSLVKPWFTPPGWVFGPVWTTLYLLMAVAAYLIWEKKNGRAKTLYIFQLFLNFLWSLIFFGQKTTLLALWEIGILWVVIGVMILEFNKIDKRTKWLLIPYWAWVSLATLLNAGVVWLNR